MISVDVGPVLKEFGARVQRELDSLEYELRTDLEYTCDAMNKRFKESIHGYPTLRKIFKGIKFEINLKFIEKESNDEPDNHCA